MPRPEDERADMVARQLRARDIVDEEVLRAMGRVPRELFVPEPERRRAFDDAALPIGEGQTISQPYMVARICEALEVRPGHNVLDVGTGSGYQAAVLAELGAEVYSIEIIEPLARRGAAALKRTGYERVNLRIGDGYRGWPEAAPFDAVLVTAAPPRIPAPLKQQLKPGGRLVVPVGDGEMQELLVVQRVGSGWKETRLEPVRFVPMTGEAQVR